MREGFLNSNKSLNPQRNRLYDTNIDKAAFMIYISLLIQAFEFIV
jgi:hypothetical protein